MIHLTKDDVELVVSMNNKYNCEHILFYELMMAVEVRYTVHLVILGPYESPKSLEPKSTTES